MTHLAHQEIGPLFEATSEATEEAIFNAMLRSATTEGRDWITVRGLTGEALRKAIVDVRERLATV